MGETRCLFPIDFANAIKRVVQVAGLSLAIVPLLATGSFAATAENPWAIITAHNVFRLQPVVLQQKPVEEAPRKAAPKVVVTGITDICGRRLALVEILELGKPLSKPLLAEGDSFGSVQILQIDLGHDRVRVRIDGEDSDLLLKAGSGAEPPERLPHSSASINALLAPGARPRR
jgi:hypothetical protein